MPRVEGVVRSFLLSSDGVDEFSGVLSMHEEKNGIGKGVLSHTAELLTIGTLLRITNTPIISTCDSFSCFMLIIFDLNPGDCAFLIA